VRFPHSVIGIIFLSIDGEGGNGEEEDFTDAKGILTFEELDLE
jgi:hypothetical protein